MKLLVISDYRSVLSARPEAEMFLRLAALSLEITIMTFPEAAYISRFQAAGIKVIPFHPVTKWSPKETQIIREELSTGQYDILHLYNGKAMLHGLVACRGLPVRTILYRGFAGNVHWYDPFAYLKYLHPRVDRIICITKEIQRDIQRQFLFRKDPTVLIHKGHDPDWYRDVPPGDLTSQGIPSGAFVFLCVANNRPFKDIPTLIRAAHLSLPKADAWLLLVGGGMDHPDILALVEAGPAASRIRLSGFRNDTAALMQSAQVIVLSSRLGEGLNKTIMEGMFLGKPVLLTDIPGNRELAQAGEGAWFVPPSNPQAMAEAMLFLAANKDLLAEAGRTAHSSISRRFHIQETVRETLRLYEQLCPGKLLPAASRAMNDFGAIES